MLADFARHTSDPFQLTTALTKLVDLYAEVENLSRAEELMQELVDRNKGDERLLATANRNAASLIIRVVNPIDLARELLP